MVTPSGAVATVQNATVRAGMHSLELIDAASFGRAQNSANATLTDPTLIASHAMLVPMSWRDAPPDLMDRFEAQSRLEFTGAAGTVGVEFGLITTHVDYNGLPSGSTAYFIEVTVDEMLVASSYQAVDYTSVADAWSVYEIRFDLLTGDATLEVDGVGRGSVSGLTGLTSLSVVQLQNQRWGTNPNDNQSVFFDDISIVTVPAPTTTGLLACVTLASLRRRTRIAA